ncbi:response regulator [Synechocystis sp. PCC 7339]|uniref:response regulator n=1 Tax=unclassified Synechocystis TaxID=2640012 RepID=UPI001BAFFD23|nr:MULTISPECIES: response regulator [unclassified Synechocystis]QUS61891.1 response regulator [Synechocystis sp. PCC 7338]UAJ74086.1 response regulator [Synechocystis sp. PCC 7339]
MTTVLIVEDDPMNFRVFSKILTKRGGFTVKGSEDVAEVLALARSKAVDVILMDVSLSRSHYQGKAYNGIQITQLLKQDPTTAGLPVILVTAHAMAGDRESLLAESGAEGYIAKPVVDHQAFVQQIQAMAGGIQNPSLEI